MYCWEDNGYMVIPLAFNIFYSESRNDKRNIGFGREFSISDEIFEELQLLLKSQSDDKITAIDMQRINYPSRMFEGLRETEKPILFFNVQGQIVHSMMEEDLPKLSWSEDRAVCFLNGEMSKGIADACSSRKMFAYKKMYSRILNDIKQPCKKGHPLLLDSSGLYSNMYITVKKLFLKPTDYYFVLYGMAAETEKLGDFDGFISSSKNGAILANLLGSLMNKKVVHIQGVGPRYSMRVGNVQNEIKRGRTYVYVSDFICTGTEMKIMSSLINSNDAYLTNTVGFAMYSDEGRKENFILKRARCLITTGEAGIAYKIAGNREDMLELMNKKK